MSRKSKVNKRKAAREHKRTAREEEIIGDQLAWASLVNRPAPKDTVCTMELLKEQVEHANPEVLAGKLGLAQGVVEERLSQLGPALDIWFSGRTKRERG